MKRNHSESVEDIQSIVRRVNSLIKLPKLNLRPNSLQKISPNHTKRTTSSPSHSNRTNYWKQKLLLSKKLAPIKDQNQNEHSEKKKPLSSMLLNKLGNVQTKNQLLQQRILNKKLIGTQNTQNLIKNSFSTGNFGFHNIITQPQERQISPRKPFHCLSQQNQKVLTNYNNRQNLLKIKQKFKDFVTQEAYKQLQIPYVSAQIFVKEFSPYWQMTDIILYACQQLNKKPRLLREVMKVYSYMSLQQNRIRKQIYRDVERLNKSELNLIILKTFVLEISFIYMILAKITWKQINQKSIEHYIHPQVKLIQTIRRQLLKIYLCDLNIKEEIKINKRIVGFISIKQKAINQIKSHTHTLQDHIKVVLEKQENKNSPIFEFDKIDNLEKVSLFQQKFKRQILGIPQLPLIFYDQNNKQFITIIEPQGFLFRQNKQTSAFILREGSVGFIKRISQYSKVVFLSRLCARTLSQYISYLQRESKIKFEHVFDKSYMTYRNLRLEKNIESLGIGKSNDMRRIVVIDSCYEEVISRQYWEYCIHVDWKQDDDEDGKMLQNLAEKIIKLACPY